MEKKTVFTGANGDKVNPYDYNLVYDCGCSYDMEISRDEDDEYIWYSFRVEDDGISNELCPKHRYELAGKY